MKKALLTLIIAVLTIPAFAQISFSGEVRTGAIVGDTTTSFSQLRLIGALAIDEFTTGEVAFRATYDSTDTTATYYDSKPFAFIQDAYAVTDVAKFLGLKDLTLKLTYGLNDLTTAQVAAIGFFQLNYVEYALAHELMTRVDAGIPAATVYLGTAYEDIHGDALYPIQAGVTGTIADLIYDVSYARTSANDSKEMGNLFVQAAYGLKLSETMKLTLAGDADCDLDDATHETAVIAGTAAGKNTINYGAAAKFEMTGDIGITASLDFMGSTFENSAGDSNYTADALGIAFAISPKIVTIDGGLIYDINADDTADGIALWYAGVVKKIGKVELRAGYAAVNKDGVDISIDDGSGNVINASTTDGPCYANLKNAGDGSVYLNASIKF